MPALVAGIHVFLGFSSKDVDGRAGDGTPGHDEHDGGPTEGITPTLARSARGRFNGAKGHSPWH